MGGEVLWVQHIGALRLSDEDPLRRIACPRLDIQLAAKRIYCFLLDLCAAVVYQVCLLIA